MPWLPLLLIVLIDIYAFQAVRTLTADWSLSGRWIVFGIYWAIPVLTALYLIAGSMGWTESWSKGTESTARSLVFILYVSKFLIALLMFGDDLRRGVLALLPQAAEGVRDLSRSRFLATIGVILGSIPFLTLTYGMLRNKYRYTVFKEKVPIKNLPKALQGFRIVQISDIHSGSFTDKEPVRKAVEIINGVDADVVFFTGDLVNSISSEMDQYMDVFDKITARRGVYSVLGNHDYGDYYRWNSPADKEANFERLKTVHKELGWDLLINENRELEIEGSKVAVIGVENYSAHPRFPKYGDLPKAYAGTEEAQVKLLLSHDPSHWKDQVTQSFQDIDITFSGHTHGMQFGIEIPGWIKWSPIKYMYKQWAGLYQEGQQYLYVNRGLGFLGYPGRVGIMPEITVLELASA